MPQRAIWCPSEYCQGPNTVQRRCSLYCAAISHTALKHLQHPSQPGALTTAEWQVRARPSGPDHTDRCRGGAERLESLALPLSIGRGLAMGRASRHSFNLLHPHLLWPPGRRHSTDFRRRLTSLSLFPCFSSSRSFTTCTTRLKARLCPFDRASCWHSVFIRWISLKLMTTHSSTIQGRREDIQSWEALSYGLMTSH